MALTNDDLQAISSLMDIKLQPVNYRLEKIESAIFVLKVGQEELKTNYEELKVGQEELKANYEELKIGYGELKAGQRELKKEIMELKDKVTVTYNLALEAWGQSTENRVWLEEESKKAIS